MQLCSLYVEIMYIYVCIIIFFFNTFCTFEFSLVYFVFIFKMIILNEERLLLLLLSLFNM